MAYDNFWNQYELYFYHEFVNDEDFEIEKKQKLVFEDGGYYIPMDYTIYQNKTKPFDSVNEADHIQNYIGFIKIICSLPFPKIKGFLDFHLKKYLRDKQDFLTFVYHELRGSKTKTSSGTILPPPQWKLLAIQWCEIKLDVSKSNLEGRLAQDNFVNKERIRQILDLETKFDVSKLVKLLEEINDSHALENYYSVAILTRSVLNHIPPFFGKEKFKEVANNVGGKSFKQIANNLDVSLRGIADEHAHVTISEKEALPNWQQVNFGPALDFILAQILKL